MDKADVQLVKVERHHLDELRQLSLTTFLDAFADANSEEDMRIYLNHAFSKTQLSEELQDTNTHFYFLSFEGELVGYFKIKFGLPKVLPEVGTALEICRLYIHQDYQGQQLGQWMLDNIIQIARDHRLDFVWLGVWSQNPGAIRLYERKGFNKVGAYTFMLGNDAQTDFIMKKELG
ncbi:ribosomal protein S18 acetylase RimI-like enzyme [Catalinimonas alkaloidigena]|uniref:GNAT family N-acetyltransferase n=1 Tax=Catalinimonas alkaloidigena TaxID=1075417 RepID=UPI002407427B|nr:GNAT family N-acetyltransferase [Catalinimonas alkaloidigena]MDF9798055.1 ribosomal protein S18 acetylase RimI-like enzyme [Catalinimonas alkaloidigena]